MAKEIERKFLVKKGFDVESLGKSVKIIQGYLSSVKERSVRVRIKENRAFLTIKGISNDSGTTRYEFETEISLKDGHDLLKICEPGIIEKLRIIVPAGKHKFEIDKFYGDNEGLIIAEIELESENESFEKPEWLGQEVTGDKKYYNSMISKFPFKNW